MSSPTVSFPEDFALAIGCAEGDPAALARFERELMPRALSAASGILAPSESVEVA